MTHPYACPCRAHRDASPASRERRRLLGLGLAGLVAGPLAGLAGCGDRQGAGAADLSPAPITGATTCGLDGMLLVDYPGPKSQLHYEGQPAPTFTCDTVEMFSLLLKPEQVRPVRAVLVQDMAQAKWEQPEGHWIDATRAVYVRGSKRMGSMGPTFASFARAEDAKAFATEFGGQVLRYAEITPAMADLSGGAHVDSRM